MPAVKSSPKAPLPTAKRIQHLGMSLIEVLIALLILSVGLLAMAGIHATSLKLTQVNKYRLAATEIAQSFSESVKANSTAAIPPATGYTTPAAGEANDAPALLCNTPAMVCNPAQIAAVDLFIARQSAQALLPSGDLFAQLNPAVAAATNNTTPTLSVWVYWVNPNVVADANLATRLEGNCPAAVAALNPPRSCVQFVVSL
jgi:type IV pilus assembly protein PilV